MKKLRIGLNIFVNPILKDLRYEKNVFPKNHEASLAAWASFFHPALSDQNALERKVSSVGRIYRKNTIEKSPFTE